MCWADFAVEFIHLISSEANEACEKEKKRTIGPEHIYAALKVAWFSLQRIVVCLIAIVVAWV